MYTPSLSVSRIILACSTAPHHRQRYAMYHEDPASMALHAAAPLIAVWDDHELANNAYHSGSEQHNETLNGPWANRVANAVRAYHEWLPTRYFIDDGNYVKIWRSFTFGDLATLALLETRITARTDSNHRLDTAVPHAPIFDAFGDVGKLGFTTLAPSDWTPDMVKNIKVLGYIAVGE